MKSFYIEAFNRYLSQLPGEQRWLKKLRQDAIANFEKERSDPKEQEKWRYTALDFFKKNKFEFKLNKTINVKSLWPKLSKYEVVFFDGDLVLTNLPRGIKCYSLEDALNKNLVSEKDLVQEKITNNKFKCLNTAFLARGLFLEVPDLIALDHPIHIIYHTNEANSTNQIRNIFKIGKKSRLTIIEHYLGGRDKYFVNLVTSYAIKEKADLSLYRLIQGGDKSYHLEQGYIEQEKKSKVDVVTISLNGALIRSDLTIDLKEQSKINLQGLFLGFMNQDHQHYTKVVHKGSFSKSNELYKGVLSDHARGVFYGEICVENHLNKIDASQKNHNILLSDNIEIIAKPQLEVFSEDVKCTHGITSGKLDEMAIFYLQSRGIELKIAKKMLLKAFIQEIIDAMKGSTIKDYLLDHIDQKLTNIY